MSNNLRRSATARGVIALPFLKSPQGRESSFASWPTSSVEPMIEDLIDVGVDALNPVQVSANNMEPEMLKEKYKGRISFWGGINTQRVLPLGTPEEVRTEVRKMIELMGKGGGYVLNSVHNIQGDVPAANIIAMFDEAGSFRPSWAA